MKDYNNKLLIADSKIKIGMVNIDINQKSVEKESTPKYDTRKQLPPHEPEGTSSKSKNPHDDELLSENDKKLAKEHIEEKESLIIVGICFILFGYAFV